MTVNVGTVDRLLRLIIGLALVTWAGGFLPQLAVVPPPWGWIVGIVGGCAHPDGGPRQLPRLRDAWH